MFGFSMFVRAKKINFHTLTPAPLIEQWQTFFSIFLYSGKVVDTFRKFCWNESRIKTTIEMIGCFTPFLIWQIVINTKGFSFEICFLINGSQSGIYSIFFSWSQSTSQAKMFILNNRSRIAARNQQLNFKLKPFLNWDLSKTSFDIASLQWNFHWNSQKTPPNSHQFISNKTWHKPALVATLLSMKHKKKIWRNVCLFIKNERKNHLKP